MRRKEKRENEKREGKNLERQEWECSYRNYLVLSTSQEFDHFYFISTDNNKTFLEKQIEKGKERKVGEGNGRNNRRNVLLPITETTCPKDGQSKTSCGKR